MYDDWRCKRMAIGRGDMESCWTGHVSLSRPESVFVQGERKGGCFPVLEYGVQVVSAASNSYKADLPVNLNSRP